MQKTLSNGHNSVFIGRWGGLCLGMMLWALPVGAADQTVPWECTGFVGEAQSRCMRTLTELQQEKNAKLEKDLAVQKQTVQHLQEQVAQQASVSANLEDQLARHQSAWYGSPSVQIYSPFGLGLGWGRDRFFGGSLFWGNSHYFGPRFYGHGYRG